MNRRIYGMAVLAAALGAISTAAAATPRGSMTWSGSVDNTAIVVLHGDQVMTNTINGKATEHVNGQVDGFLPDLPERVILSDASGRGNIQIVQQPDPDNDFTARIRIDDPQPIRSWYQFTVQWEPRFGMDADGDGQTQYFGDEGRDYDRPIRPSFRLNIRIPIIRNGDRD